MIHCEGLMACFPAATWKRVLAERGGEERAASRAEEHRFAMPAKGECEYPRPSPNFLILPKVSAFIMRL